MTIHINSQETLIRLRSNLDISTNKYNQSMSRLSSGNKYTSISEAPVQITQASMTNITLSANKQAVENVQKGQNILSIADSTQEGVISNLQRIRDLCTQAANDTYSSTDKDAILTEIKQRLQQIDQTADSTEYNGIKLFNGTLTSLKIQFGLNATNTIDIGSAFTNLHISQLGGVTNGLKIDNTVNGSNWTNHDINNYADLVDNAITTLTHGCAISGGFTNRLASKNSILDTTNQSLTAAHSTMSDTDFASESTRLVQFQILQQVDASILTQANQVSAMAISLLK